MSCITGEKVWFIDGDVNAGKSELKERIENHIDLYQDLMSNKYVHLDIYEPKTEECIESHSVYMDHIYMDETTNDLTKKLGNDLDLAFYKANDIDMER